MSDPAAPSMIVMCASVAEMPVPHVPSVRLDCATCDTPIWFAKASVPGLVAALRATTGAAGARFLCSACAAPALAAAKTVVSSRGQREAIRAVTGQDQVPRQVAAMLGLAHQEIDEGETP